LLNIGIIYWVNNKNMKKIHLNVKPFQETLHADMCGPASLKIVLDYYGLNKTEKELAGLCKLVPGLGVDDKSIAEATETLGFKVEIKNDSSFKDIENWLLKDVPVVVDWFTRGRQDYDDSEVADGHYSVVFGLDDDLYIYKIPRLVGSEK